jgi:hypothetical protein
VKDSGAESVLEMYDSLLVKVNDARIRRHHKVRRSAQDGLVVTNHAEDVEVRKFMSTRKKWGGASLTQLLLHAKLPITRHKQKLVG